MLSQKVGQTLWHLRSDYYFGRRPRGRAGCAGSAGKAELAALTKPTTLRWSSSRTRSSRSRSRKGWVASLTAVTKPTSSRETFQSFLQNKPQKFLSLVSRNANTAAATGQRKQQRKILKKKRKRKRKGNKITLPFTPILLLMFVDFHSALLSFRLAFLFFRFAYFHKLFVHFMIVWPNFCHLGLVTVFYRPTHFYLDQLWHYVFC